MEHLLDDYITRAIERNDLERALSYKWLRNSDLGSFVEVLNTMQWIHADRKPLFKWENMK